MPDRDLEWTEVDFPQDPKQGYVSGFDPASDILIGCKWIKQIKLSGSVGSNKQRFIFQGFISP